MKQQGFTLIEVMITVVIIGIIMSVAIPNYRDYVTRSRIPEATAGLSDIRVRMEQFFQDNRAYPATCVVAPTLPAATTPPTQLQVPLGSAFDFSCATTATTFTVTAAGKNQMTGFGYTIDNFNGKASNFSGAALAGGWAVHAPNTCWATKKGGGC
jgi:type IV pilus assembly protein PilE